MKRILILCAVLFALSAALLVPALAAGSDALYPTSITVSDDWTELRKVYDLSPESDPAGIPRSDFEFNGFAYTFVDILRQELPEYQERQHTETVTVNSKNKDMESVLALLPQEREVVTEDGLSGILTLKLDTVRVEVAGYSSSTKNVSATRTYPNLDGQDTSYIPKTIEDDGKTLTLQTIKWEMIGAEGSERYTAIATYTGTAKSSYVSGYTVTAEYTGTVSKIALDRVRYVAIFSGVSLNPTEPEPEETDPATQPDPGTIFTAPTEPSEPTQPQEPVESGSTSHFPWTFVFALLGVIGILGVGVVIALIVKQHSEKYYEDEEER